MKKFLTVIIAFMLMFTYGCSKSSNSIPKLSSLPKYEQNINSPYQVDVRDKDLSGLDLTNELNNLEHAVFNTSTKWTKKLPNEYNPKKVLEYGKDPGLGLKSIHKKGINGENIGIAIIDKKLLKDHNEYKNNLQDYKEIHNLEMNLNMDGAAVASIAVGKNIGVAPKANLYYVATDWEDISSQSDGVQYNFIWLAESIDYIIEINKSLDSDKKIRVISASVGISENQKGYKEFMEAVDRAKEANIFVVTPYLNKTYGFGYDGLGREILQNPNETSSYNINEQCRKAFYEEKGELYNNKAEKLKYNEILLVPMDSRTVASETGKDDYVFYPCGGWNWCAPYISGLYALACQVNPDMTPDLFWKTALETGDSIKIQNDENQYELKKIVNPEKLMNKLKENK
ncbi:peptidase S8 [Clostridium senegalense]|uniref:S8 family serine peptidase n=1 Tax=Clostridium senegalense TaxID=1465809 RepID=UPI001C103B6E|nr:S8 family serine peptidase [Clostridium senegalense]MBU5227005.1 peptidase S8 [Clostridium senegalense]